MALKENYKDDILDVSVNTKRKYRMTENADGTVSLEDETVYTQEGDSFGASDMNATNGKVNALETDIGEINDNLTANNEPFKFAYDSDNDEYGYEINGEFKSFGGKPVKTVTKNVSVTLVASGDTVTYGSVDCSNDFDVIYGITSLSTQYVSWGTLVNAEITINKILKLGVRRAGGGSAGTITFSVTLVGQ